MDLHRLARDRHRRLAGEVLGHRRFHLGAFACVQHLRGAEDEQTRHIHRGRHLSEHGCDELMAGDHLAVLPAHLGVGQPLLEGTAGDSHALHRHKNPGAFEQRERVAQRLALATDRVCDRHTYVAQKDLRSRLAVERDLVDVAHFVTVFAAVDQDVGEAALRIVGRAAGADEKVGIAAVADPGLLAVDHPVIAVAQRAGPDLEHVGADVGLRYAHADETVTGEQTWKVTLPQRRWRDLFQKVRAEGIDQHRHGEVRRRRRHFLEEHECGQPS